MLIHGYSHAKSEFDAYVGAPAILWSGSDSPDSNFLSEAAQLMGSDFFLEFNRCLVEAR